MKITTQKNGTELTVSLDGKLDSTSAPALKKELEDHLDGVERLVFDFEHLLYVSSAGLRVLISAMDMMDKQGTLVVRNVSDFVREILTDTGLIDDLVIE